MTAGASWADALDQRGNIDWAKFPFPRPCVPISMPFPAPRDSWEQAVNDRHEALALEVLATGRRPAHVEILLVMTGVPMIGSSGYPPGLRKARAS